MSYAVSFTSGAERQFGKLPTQVQATIWPRITALATEPRPPGSKKLQGSDQYRLRVGDYRVVYLVNDQARTVRVTVVAHRRDVYR